MGISPTKAISDFLASAHVFTAAVSDVIEEYISEEATGGELTLSQLKLLKLVNIRQAQTIGDVAAFLGISIAAASKAVDKLVRRSLLRRVEGKTDRRVMYLSLADASRRILAEYDAARQRKLEQVFGEIDPEEFLRAANLLDRLSARVLEHTAASEEICLRCGIYFREECLMRKMLGSRCFYQEQKHPPDSLENG